MIPAYPVYLFDVDGTLLDSAEDITGAVRVVLAEEGVTGLPQAYLRSFIGKHLFELFDEVLPDRSLEEHQEVLARYRAIYKARLHASTHVYPGVPEMLAQLGGRKGTATTKGSETTHEILKQFGLGSYFDHIQGTDGFPAKPEPDVLLRSMAALGAAPSECLMVGDSAADMAAGRRAGVRTCGVRYGYGNQEEMQRFEPDYWIDSPLELLPLVVG